MAGLDWVSLSIAWVVAGISRIDKARSSVCMTRRLRGFDSVDVDGSVRSFMPHWRTREE